MRSSSPCEHLASAPPADPPADPAADPAGAHECVDCVRVGSGSVSLRMCLTCGDIRCCDSSPHAHATAHFRATGHPVMRSVEPGQAWRWCYLHQVVG